MQAKDTHADVPGAPARTWRAQEIANHRHEMKEALDGGLISQAEYDGQMGLVDEAEAAGAPDAERHEYDSASPPAQQEAIPPPLRWHTRDCATWKTGDIDLCDCGALAESAFKKWWAAREAEGYQYSAESFS